VNNLDKRKHLTDKMLGQVCLSVTVAVIALIVGFSFVPLPENIEMSTWTSKSPPAFEGILAPNERLKSICRKVSEGKDKFIRSISL
jgi:hypothetical protein